jgi:precorrin-3B synthase
MPGAPEIKGWCPGALTPMESGDGLLMRAKVVGSKLSLTQAREIAAIALDCGNGRIDLSQRAQLQIRGVTETTLTAAQARLKSIGLLALDAATESRLNIVASPLANSASFDANEIAARLARAIAEDQALKALPGKFLFLVDDGSAPGLRDVDADIRLEARGALFAVVLDGARDQAVIASPTAAIDAAVALAHAFTRLRAGRPFELRRMRALVDAMGVEPLLRASGLKSEPYSSTCRQGALADLLGAREVGENFFSGFAAPFGRFLAGEFANLADAASREGATELRLTPWRAILAPTRSLEQAARVVEAARALGFIVDAADARLAIAACPGAPECSQAKGPTRIGLDAIANVARALSRGGIGAHVSGCAKGCAKPMATPLTLVANGGLFDLVYNGAASDAPAATGLTLAEIADVVARNGLTEAWCPRG